MDANETDNNYNSNVPEPYQLLNKAQLSLVKNIFLYEHTMKGTVEIDPALEKQLMEEQKDKRKEEEIKAEEDEKKIEILSEEELFSRLKKIGTIQPKETKAQILEGLLSKQKFDTLFRI